MSGLDDAEDADKVEELDNEEVDAENDEDIIMEVPQEGNHDSDVFNDFEKKVFGEVMEFKEHFKDRRDKKKEIEMEEEEVSGGYRGMDMNKTEENKLVRIQERKAELFGYTKDRLYCLEIEIRFLGIIGY